MLFLLINIKLNLYLYKCSLLKSIVKKTFFFFFEEEEEEELGKIT
jgi:hypothetical protein